jgi:glucosamine kinase
VAGVDGGGSKTRTVVADETGRVLGTADGPPSAVRAGAVGGAEHSADVVAAAVRDALEAAGLTGARVQAIVAGVAGTGREPERDALWQALTARAVAEEISVVPDAAIALDDAFGDGPGVLLIAGTGSVAFARGPDGTFARAGGWGPVLGDEGSGGWLGRRALNAAVASLDGREPETALANALLAAVELDDPAGLVAWAARAKPADFAALAPGGRPGSGGRRPAGQLAAHARGRGARTPRAHARPTSLRGRARGGAGRGRRRAARPRQRRAAEALRAATPDGSAGRDRRQEPVDPTRGAVRGALKLLGVELS